MVTSAQFLLDSESSVRASLQRLNKPAATPIWAEGVINTVEATARTLNVTHEPINALNWPAMTMDFPVAKGVKLDGLKPDSKIRFRLRQGEDGRYQIEALEAAGFKP